MNSAAHAVFDTPEAVQLNKARQDAVRELLVQLQKDLALRTTVDVGCGIGHLSCFLRDVGFSVVAADGREENISVGKQRYPQIDFQVANVETDSLTQLGSFDLVFCMGLLYHLENPFLAVRRLRTAAKSCLLLESMCIPEDRPSMVLQEEYCLDNQSLTHVAFYPTESCLVKMLYRAGFDRVYRLAMLPEHDDFRETPAHRRRRTILVAFLVPFLSPMLVPLTEPTEGSDPWDRTKPAPASLTRRMARYLGTAFRGYGK